MLNNMTSLWKKSAAEIIKLIDKKEVSSEEVLSSSLSRISEVNSKINALVTICEDRARLSLKNNNISNANNILNSMPVIIKDMNDVQGVRTTYGSRLYESHIPKKSDIVVETIEKNGGIILGKSNIPEFAAGSHTYNDLFGTTYNPWNTTLSAGGSSGGSAAALASGMAWFATGSDLGGSLRNPASWCGVTGLRPTPGLIPHGPAKMPFLNLSVDGPMARNIEDLSLFLDAMITHNNKDPLSFKKALPSYFSNISNISDKKYLVGFTEDFGIFACDPEVRNMMQNTLKLVEGLGHNIVNEHPEMKGAEETFQTIRAYLFFSTYQHLSKKNQTLIKEEVLWNIEEGKKLKVDDLIKAEDSRTRIYNNSMEFFDKFDFLIVPSSAVPPFNSKEKWVKKIENTTYSNYVSWLMIAASISLTGCPSLALATSFSNNGAPFGIQIISAPHEEEKLLKFAKTIEESINIADLVPIDAKDAYF